MAGAFHLQIKILNNLNQMTSIQVKKVFSFKIKTEKFYKKFNFIYLISVLLKMSVY